MTIVDALQLALASIGSLALAHDAQADFIGLEAERIFENDLGESLVGLGMPGDLAVWRLYATFSDPTDRLVAVEGVPDTPFSIFTSTGDGFWNQTVLGTDQPPSLGQAMAFPDLWWDSWYTIGYSLNDVYVQWPSGADDTTPIITTPGLPGPNSDPWTTDDGLWVVVPSEDDPGTPERDFMPTPRTVAGNYPQGPDGTWRVLMTQLTVHESQDIFGSMGIIVFEDGDGTLLKNVTFSTLPAPGGLALLVLFAGRVAAAGTRRRRRRRGLVAGSHEP